MCSGFKLILLILIIIVTILSNRNVVVEASQSKWLSLTDFTFSAHIILTDPTISKTINSNLIDKNLRIQDKDLLYHKAIKRLEYGRNFSKSLPFPVNEWWSVIAFPCPRNPHRHFKHKGNDRGVLLAHKQIWDDFLHQENYGEIVKESDMLIVFEDDAVSSVSDLKWSLENEFNHMNRDLVLLGWCHGGKNSKRFPMCAHAYIITRAGARKILKQWDACGASLDGQWAAIANKKIFTWRKALESSYINSTLPGYENYFTQGMFRQQVGIVSFNYNWWDNNTKPAPKLRR